MQIGQTKKICKPQHLLYIHHLFTCCLIPLSMAQNPANVNYAYPPPAAPFTGPPNVNQAPAYPPAPGAGPPPASPVAQPPQAGPVGINPPSPYGQPPPPYAPSPYGAQSPSSPNVYGQHPQSPTPAAQPTVATKPPPKSRFCCCKYLVSRSPTVRALMREASRRGCRPSLSSIWQCPV